MRMAALRVAVTGAAVLLLLHGVDGAAVLHSLAGIDGGWLLLSVALTALAYGLSVIEWGVLVRALSARAGWGAIAAWQVQSVFVGSVVPGGAGGDAFRAVQAARVVGTAPSLASLLCSRMAGSCGMAGWALCSAVLLHDSFGWITVIAAAVLVTLIAIGWGFALCAPPLIARLRRSSLRLMRAGAIRVSPLSDALHCFRARGDAVLASVAAGVLGWTVNLVALAALSRAVGVAAGPQLFAVLVPLSLLTTLAPFTMSGVGLREGVLVGLLVHSGVDPQRAIALAVLVDLQPLPVALCGGLLWLLRRGQPLCFPRRPRGVAQW